MYDSLRPWNRVLYALMVLCFSIIAPTTSRAQFVQQGGKLAGTGAGIGISNQGFSVALSSDGNTSIVGGEADDGAAGAVWVYTRTGGVWTQQGGKLVGTGAIGNARQGESVALSADGSTAIIGGGGDNFSVGAAWVFTRSGNTWMQQGGKLVGTGALGNASQGSSVALSGDGNTAIVGGPEDNGAAGAVWVYTRSGGVWTQQGGKLIGTGAVANGNLGAIQGTSVALSADGNTALVGGQYDNAFAGAAWVFTRSGNTWTQQGTKLVGTGATGLAHQGTRVALSGDGNTATISGPYDNSSAGAAWVFSRSDGVWTQRGKLVGTGAVGRAFQGVSVALSGDGNTAVLGGDRDDGFIGAVWMFRRSGGAWSQLGDKLVGLDHLWTSGYQGHSAALSADGNTLIEGGYGDDYNLGAAWVFASTSAFPVKPTITSVLNGASFMPGDPISPGSWVTIFGIGLAPAGDSRTWNAATEIINGKFPLSIDGTSVNVNGKPAAVEFVGPNQVNIQAPDDTAVGPVQVVVTTAAGVSNSFTANYATFAPGLFMSGISYIVAQHADYSYVTEAAPAKPGEVITVWGTGFGPANPTVPAGQVFSGASPLANPVGMTFSGYIAPVVFAGVVGAGLVQINVLVPFSVTNGSAVVGASVGGVSSGSHYLPVHK